MRHYNGVVKVPCLPDIVFFYFINQRAVTFMPVPISEFAIRSLQYILYIGTYIWNLGFNLQTNATRSVQRAREKISARSN